jgi:hypothetical protein
MDTSKQRKRINRELDLDLLRDGRKNRAVRFVNRQKERSRRACRDRNLW